MTVWLFLVYKPLWAENKSDGCFTEQHLGHVFYHLQTSKCETELLSISQLFSPAVPFCGAPRSLYLEGGQGAHPWGLGSAPHLSPPEPWVWTCRELRLCPISRTTPRKAGAALFLRGDSAALGLTSWVFTSMTYRI